MSKIVSYAQGFAQMKAASEQYNWNLQYGDIAMIFRGGCIIRAQFLQKIKDAYDRDANLNNLLLDPYFKDIVENYQGALREVIATAVMNGIPVPCFASALSYFDSYRTETLPANLSKLNVIISVLILMNVWIKRAFSIQNGWRNKQM